MPNINNSKLAAQAAGSLLIDIAHAKRIVGDVIAKAPVISNNKTFDEYELKAALKGESPAIKAAALAAFNSAKNDAEAKGEPLTRWNVSKKLDAALAAVEAADKNNSGRLSKAELSTLQSFTPLRLAVAAAGVNDAPTGKMSTAEFGKAANAIMRGVNVMSEGDSSVTFIASAKTKKALTPENVIALFSAPLQKVFEESDLSDYRAEVSSTAKAKKMLSELSKVDEDADEPIEAQIDSECYTKLKTLFASNLTAVRFVRIGEKAPDSDALGESRGTYVEMLVGKTVDGKFAGVSWTSAET